MAESRQTTSKVFCMVMLLSGFLHDYKIVQGQKLWCTAKPSASDVELEANVNYVCNDQHINCSIIYEVGACHFPYTRINHASVVMNLYYQKMRSHAGDCSFKNSALLVITDPSYQNCSHEFSQLK
ncbi:hypothetical protein ACH5RR_018599 [Cinchona calisaya]|uniref:X8 domain-containing protein n=1 Tax=Cinchona calisaya TaxID=153742 RepID=A0ABD2ZQ13_9GENT